jgi:circadian clock protein KaiB
MTGYRFRLYVLGPTSRSRNAEQQLRALCAQRVRGPCAIEVVDLTEAPELADTERIVATPTLDRVEPPPRVRVVGDLGSSERLSAVLDLPPEYGPQGEDHPP